MSSGEPKQYGLILPSKNKNKVGELGSRKLNPLLESDDELDQDEESPLNWVEASLKKSAGNSGQQSLQKRLLREALEEDASVFQYDEVYDSMQAAKTAQQDVKELAAKKPKYIHNLMKHAEKRKLEGERRNERKVQREREAEGEEFADKESFVTASYLKKMEELKKAEEEAKMQEMKEEQVDVMKHKNFGVFYSHLFKQRMGEPVIKEEPKSGDEEEGTTKDKQLTKKGDNKRQKHYRTQRDLSDSPERQEQRRTQPPRHSSPSSSDSDAPEKVESYRDRRKRYDAIEKDRECEKERRTSKLQIHNRSRDKQERSRERHHGRERMPEQERRHRGRQRSGSPDRRRRHSRSRSPVSGRVGGSRGDRQAHKRSSTKVNSPDRPVKKETLTPNSNASEESKGGTSDKRDTKDRISDRKTSKVDVKVKKDDKEEVKVKKGNEKEIKVKKENENEVKVKKENKEEEKERRQERIQKLFTKRTVGEKFNEAVQRYYQRKAEREAQG